eukprot:g23582.t1
MSLLFENEENPTCHLGVSVGLVGFTLVSFITTVTVLVEVIDNVVNKFRQDNAPEPDESSCHSCPSGRFYHLHVVCSRWPELSNLCFQFQNLTPQNTVLEGKIMAGKS